MIERASSCGQVALAESAPRSWLLPSAAEMAQLDRNTIANGTSGLELMERAGAAIVDRIRGLLPSPVRCLVLCGPGNNGGDGLVISRLLRQHGFTVDTVLAASERYSAECMTQLAKTEQVKVFGGTDLGVGQKLPQLSENELSEVLRKAELIVDALLGTGPREAPRGVIKTLIERLRVAKHNGRRQITVAVDIPTGLDADTGRLFEPHVQADYSLTVQFVKRGMLQYPGRSACGVISAVPIGISSESTVEFSLMNAYSAPSITPRAPDVHKGLLGRVLIVGGSLAMPGAPMLSAAGALRAGAGIVTRVIRRSWHTVPALPEAMYQVLEGDADFFTQDDTEAVLANVQRHDVLVLGPGLGTKSETAAFVNSLLAGLENSSTSIVIDADALNLVAGSTKSFARHRAVLTPHPGEASRLLGVTSEEVQSDRFMAVKKLAERYQSSVVLKGAGTLVHNGKCGMLIAEGTPYLATPGSGDVLAGIIAAYIPRSDSVYDAAAVGAWVHARAGVKAEQLTGGTILASDIALALGAFCR